MPHTVCHSMNILYVTYTQIWTHNESEPLIRKEIYEIVSNLNELRSHSLETIGITTNG